MPIYTYQGLESGEVFEQEQRITEPALTHHPKTGEPVKRLIGAVGIVFKGSGFYKTDSRASNKSSNHNASEKKSDASTTTETSGTSSNTTNTQTAQTQNTSNQPTNKSSETKPSPKSSTEKP